MKTLHQVRTLLGDIEPTEQTFSPLDANDIAHLMTLLGDDEDWLAARAVHALSRIDDPRALAGIRRAAADPRGAVRVAVASALPRMPVAFAERMADDLLDDKDASVRKFTLRAVPAAALPRLQAKIERMAQADASETVRALARSVHTRLPERHG